MPEVVWTSRAEESLLGIYCRLEEDSAGRGELFLRALDTVVSFLEVYPKMGAIQFDTVRRLLIRGSSFGLFYVVENRGVIVLRICDLRQNPEWLKRQVLGTG